MDRDAIVEDIRAGRHRALGRAISIAEAGGPECTALLRALAADDAPALRLGLTGPPGAGKSTLASRLVACARRAGIRVAVVAVDPSSPGTGGALLGDRARMEEHTLDGGVFIRSMASRGHPGGLAAAVEAAARILGAGGVGLIVLEGVGSGQLDGGVAAACDVTVLVTTPAGGDAVQAMKAGIMEVADVIVVNRCEMPGAAAAAAAIREGLGPDAARRHLVLETSAVEGTGVEALWAHVQAMGAAGDRAARRRAAAAAHLRRVAVGRAEARLMAVPDAVVEGLAGGVARGERDLEAAADELARLAWPGSLP